MRGRNELTKLLLNAGYINEDPPDFVETWNDFYGGWTYNRKIWNRLVFETPCGLLVSGADLCGGTTQYMGVDFTLENNNYTVCCPKFDREPCGLNHEVLRNRPHGPGEPKSAHCEFITQCACHLSNKPYEYKYSLDKAHNDVQTESDKLFKLFNEQKKGRACRHHSRYNRTTKTWTMIYNPRDYCAKYNMCGYCNVLQTELSEKKGNIYYDIKTTWTEKGIGLLPDEEKTVIKKGVKLLERPVSATICER